MAWLDTGKEESLVNIEKNFTTLAKDEIYTAAYGGYIVLVSIVFAFGLSGALKRFNTVYDVALEESGNAHSLMKALITMRIIVGNDAANYAPNHLDVIALIDNSINWLWAACQDIICREYPYLANGRFVNVSTKCGNKTIYYRDYQEPQTTESFNNLSKSLEQVASGLNNYTITDSSEVDLALSNIGSLSIEFEKNRRFRTDLAYNLTYNNSLFFYSMVILCFFVFVYPFILSRESTTLKVNALVSLSLGLFTVLILYLIFEYAKPYGGYIRIERFSVWGSFLKDFEKNEFITPI